MTNDLADAQLRYTARLDGLAQGTARRIAADVQRAIDAVTADLARRVPDDAPFTFDRLQRLRQELTALQQALTSGVGAALSEAREAVLETAPVSVQAAVGGSFVAVPIETLRQATAAPFQGKTFADWGNRLASKTMASVEAELRDAVILGENVGTVAKRLQSVAGLQRKNAERLARTALSDWSSRTHLEIYRENRDVVQEYEISAVFDGRTSEICMGLSGKRFKIDDPSAPRPPFHPSCRSVVLPVTASLESIVGPEGRAADERLAASREKPAVMSSRRVKDIPKEARPKVIRTVKADLTYDQWLKTTTPEFQKEVLGPAKYTAWKKGVPLSGMATYSRPLSIEELKRLYPKEFSDG